MRPIEQLSKGPEEPMPAALGRVEEILRSAADFEPETEATYNFAAAAMARRRFHARSLFVTAAGCACTALLVWWAVPRMMGSRSWIIQPPPTRVVDGASATMGNVAAGDTGYSDNRFQQVREGAGELANSLHYRPRYSLARNHSDRSDGANGFQDDREESQPAPKAKWETEAVDRYASGLIKPTFIEEKRPDGSIVRKPAVEVIPLQSGERPATEGSGDMGVASLANYETGQGEATK
jgi:hypothetical protein